MSSTIWIASFDIGRKNFCFYIEEIDVPTLRTIKQNNAEIKTKYNIDGTPTDDFSSVIDQIFSIGSSILLQNNTLSDKTHDAMYKMTELLDRYDEFWKQCDICLIERQMKVNTSAMKLAQHCWSYFSIKYPNIRIVEFPAYHKTQVLGMPKSLRKQKKTWTVEMALAVFQLREDTDIIQLIEQFRKQDDLGDTVCQLQAYKIIMM